MIKFIKIVYARIKAKTPDFFKWIRRFGWFLVTTGTAIRANGVDNNWITAMLVAGPIFVGFASLVYEDETEYKKYLQN